MDEEDQFFKDINTLYQRQKVLFQKCCEQLKDIYLVRIKTKIIVSSAAISVTRFGEIITLLNIL